MTVVFASFSFCSHASHKSKARKSLGLPKILHTPIVAQASHVARLECAIMSREQVAHNCGVNAFGVKLCFILLRRCYIQMTLYNASHQNNTQSSKVAYAIT